MCGVERFIMTDCLREVRVIRKWCNKGQQFVLGRKWRLRLVCKMIYVGKKMKVEVSM